MGPSGEINLYAQQTVPASHSNSYWAPLVQDAVVESVLSDEYGVLRTPGRLWGGEYEVRARMPERKYRGVPFRR